MPKKEYKNRIMQSLLQPHNPFCLTAEELQEAEELLTAMENDARWTESLKMLADILETVSVEFYEKPIQKSVQKPVLKSENKPVQKKAARESPVKTQPVAKPLIKRPSGKEFYEGYGKFIKKYGEAGSKMINSNKVEDLMSLYNSKAMNAAGKDYLAHRITELQKVRQLEAVSVPGKAKEVKPSKDGSIVLPTVQREPQNSANGCWSVSLATQLQYRGVDLDQKTLRAFRPNTKMADAKDVFCANKDTANYIENYAELVQDVLPDTAVNNVTCDRMDKAEDAEKCLRACVQRALVEDHAPLSVVFNGHYRTIFGIQKDPGGDASKDVLLFHDPYPGVPNPQHATVKDFVDLCDTNLRKRNENYQKDPHYKFAFQFSATWLQDLHMNEKGELGGEFQKLGLSYENGALKCTNSDVVGMGSDKVQTIFGGGLTADVQNDVHIYLPKKSYALLKAEREKARAAEAEKTETAKKATKQPVRLNVKDLENKVGNRPNADKIKEAKRNIVAKVKSKTKTF